MKFRFVKNFLIIFIFILLFSFVVNYLVYKTYRISFNVYSDNIPRIETIAFHKKNIDHPLFSSIRYSRNYHDIVEVYLMTNDMDQGLDLIKRLNKDFRLYVLGQTSKFFEFAKTYYLYEKDFSDYLLIRDFFIYREQRIISPLSLTNDEITNEELEKYDLRQIVEKFKNFLFLEKGYKEELSEEVSELLAFASIFYNISSVSDVEIKTLNKKLISLKDIFIIFLFSLIGSGFLSVKEKLDITK